MAFKLNNVSVSITGKGGFTAYEPSEVIRALGASINAAISDLTPVWQKVVTEVLQPAVAEQFASEGNYFEAPWVELAPSTIDQRKSDHPILRRTDRLMDSFDTGGLEHIEVLAPDSLEWGSETPYANYHQMGTERMPPREIIPTALNEGVRADISAIVKEGIETAIKDAGFEVEP